MFISTNFITAAEEEEPRNDKTKVKKQWITQNKKPFFLLIVSRLHHILE